MLEDMDLFGMVNTKKNENRVKADRRPFGIDLGTTNSAISVGLDSGDAQVIKLTNGKRTMPSVVMWRGGDNFVVGQEAYDHDCDDSVVSSVKRLMQDADATVTFKYNGQERTMTPTEVSALILKGLVEQTGRMYGEVKDVVVTVPAYFNNIGVSNTKRACELAGLNCLHVMREPTAAALNYNLDKSESKVQYAVVYDLGGGTFDVSLIRITDREAVNELYELYNIERPANDKSTGRLIEPQAIDGDGRLGGDDYDHELYLIILRKLLDRLSAKGIDFTEDDIPDIDKRRITRKAEIAKRDVECRHNLAISFVAKDGTEVKEEIALDPEDFVKGFMPIYLRTKKLLNSVLRYAHCPVSTILLMGGSTKNPILKSLLEKDYPGFEISGALNPDEAVAQGAGKKARNFLYGDADVQIFDVLPQAIGILSGDKILHMIKRNSQIPTTAQKYFKTIEDNQEYVRIRIFQGNSVIPEECTELGEMLIDGLAPKPAGETIVAAVLHVNSDCILHCKSAVGDKLREITLNLNTSKIESSHTEDKNVIRWRRHASKMEPAAAKELLAMLDEYGTRYSKDDIANFILAHKQHREYDTKKVTDN